MARLIIKSGFVPAHSLELRLGTVRVGRNPENDFQIDHPSISSSHCEIYYGDDRVVVRDLGSTNGTFIDGNPISEAELIPGQVLAMGEVTFDLDTAIAEISVPELSRETFEVPVMPNGKAACYNHPELPARRQCTRCEQTYCDSCVHVLRLVKGRAHILCPHCSGHCQLILAPAEPESKLRALIKPVASLFKKTFKFR
jgi:hypothetical protein